MVHAKVPKIGQSGAVEASASERQTGKKVRLGTQTVTEGVPNCCRQLEPATRVLSHGTI